MRSGVSSHTRAIRSCWAVLNAPYLSMKAPFSAGALCSSVTDLVAWTSALMNGKVVTRASLDQMIAPAKLNDGSATTYGFGLGIPNGDKKAISHGGGINGSPLT